MNFALSPLNRIFATERINDLLIRDNCLTSDFFSGGIRGLGFGCLFLFQLLVKAITKGSVPPTKKIKR